MSNHLGDTNKMVDTPRTEAEVNRQKCWSDDLITIDANFACQLERELNAANYEVQHLREAYIQLQEGNERQRQRIKRLEEAGDAIFLLAEKHAPEYWLYTQTAFNNWRKSKEAKL